MARNVDNLDDTCHLPACLQHFRRVEDHVSFLDRRMLEQFAALDKRFDAANHIREALKDQSDTLLSVMKDKVNTMLPYKEHELYVKSVDTELRSLRESRAVQEGKASQKSVNAATAIAVLGLIISLAALFIRAIIGH